MKGANVTCSGRSNTAENTQHLTQAHGVQRHGLWVYTGRGFPESQDGRAGVLAAVELCLIRYTFLEVCHVSQLKTLK